MEYIGTPYTVCQYQDVTHLWRQIFIVYKGGVNENKQV
jgi:hypothetical protein